MSQPWQPQQYDPRQHQQRLGQQYPPQPPPGYSQPPYMPPQPPRRKPWPARHKVLTALGSATGLFIAIGIAAAAASPPAPSPSPSQQQPPVAATRTAAAPPARPAAPVKPRLVAAFKGSGQQNTRRFTTTATWKLAYSFNCSGFGYRGNFEVLEDGTFGAMTVNDLAMHKTASSWAYNDAGTHYLQIGSECAWTAQVWDEGS